MREKNARWIGRERQTSPDQMAAPNSAISSVGVGTIRGHSEWSVLKFAEGYRNTIWRAARATIGV